MSIDTQQLTVSDRLRALALHEQMLCRLGAETWPEVVERAYHVGRQLAFEEAARVVHERDLAPLSEPRTGERDHREEGAGSC